MCVYYPCIKIFLKRERERRKERRKGGREGGREGGSYSVSCMEHYGWVREVVGTRQKAVPTVQVRHKGALPRQV